MQLSLEHPLERAKGVGRGRAEDEHGEHGGDDPVSREVAGERAGGRAGGGIFADAEARVEHPRHRVPVAPHDEQVQAFAARGLGRRNYGALHYRRIADNNARTPIAYWVPVASVRTQPRSRRNCAGSRPARSAGSGSVPMPATSER